MCVSSKGSNNAKGIYNRDSEANKGSAEIRTTLPAMISPSTSLVYAVK